MDVVQELDHDVIVARAEDLRFWLLGFELSSRATSAIQRELGAIIADDGHVTSERPLSGLTPADFIAELHRPYAGVLANLRGIGPQAIAELRAALPADTTAPPPAPILAQAVASPGSDSRAGGPEPAEPADRAQPVRRRRHATGGKAAKRDDQSLQEHPVASYALAARPEPIAIVPLPTAPAAARQEARQAHTATGDDPLLRQIIQSWPSLHPQARRAVLLYTSTLLAAGVPEA